MNEELIRTKFSQRPAFCEKASTPVSVTSQNLLLTRDKFFEEGRLLSNNKFSLATNGVFQLLNESYSQPFSHIHPHLTILTKKYYLKLMEKFSRESHKKKSMSCISNPYW